MGDRYEAIGLDAEAMAAARELKQAISDNAYPAADGTADIDNHATPLIAITLREFANRAVAAALREQDRWYAIDDPEHPAPRDGTPFLAATWIRGQLRWRVVVRIWQRWYDDKDGPPFEIWARLMLPAPPPDTGRDTIPRDTGGGDG